MRHSKLFAVYLLVLCLYKAERAAGEEFAEPDCTLACYNGGRCQIGSSDGDEQHCVCLEGFAGSFCEILIGESPPEDPSCTLICEKGGQCEMITTADGMTMHCVCAEDVDGTPCLYKGNDSTGDSTCTLECENGGVCQVGVNGVDDSRCSCPVGFVGVLCEQQSNGENTSPPVSSQGSKKGGKVGLSKGHAHDGKMRKKKEKGMMAKIAKDTRR
jgi:hypothetical protein